jgi:hypothetical protein
MSDFSRIGTNSGHGHVWERPDGERARCGGPGLCSECRADEQLVKSRAQSMAAPAGDVVPAPTQDLAARRRREIVRAIADLSEKHNLPMPMDIGFSSQLDLISLRLNDNCGGYVRGWAEALGTGEVTRTRVGAGKGFRAFDAVKSELHDHSGPTWFGAQMVGVWAADFTPEGEPS